MKKKNGRREKISFFLKFNVFFVLYNSRSFLHEFNQKDAYYFLFKLIYYKKKHVYFYGFLIFCT